MKDASPIIILLVDDSATARLRVQMSLQDGVQVEYALLEAASLATAIEILASTPVAVILLDLNLGDSEGLETFRVVQRHAGQAAVVIISGDKDQETAITAVRDGAQDYIVKGAGFTSSLLGRTVQFAIERNTRHMLETELASMRHDLELADTIQQRLYPHGDSAFAHASVAGQCCSATLNCGDYYDYITRNDGSLVVVIGDVSGHGFGPAMMMVETRAFVRALAASPLSLGEILTQVNRLISDDMQQQIFVTLFMANFDADGEGLRFCSAGHPGYLVKPAGEVIKLQSESPPLGVTPTEIYREIRADEFARGDVLAMFTDGISEATNDYRAFLGDGRVVEEIVSGRHLAAPEILESLFVLAKNFNGKSLQQDDRTAVIVKTAAATR